MPTPQVADPPQIFIENLGIRGLLLAILLPFRFRVVATIARQSDDPKTRKRNFSIREIKTTLKKQIMKLQQREDNIKAAKSLKPRANEVVGIDLGLRRYATLSDGTFIDAPAYLAPNGHAVLENIFKAQHPIESFERRSDYGQAYFRFQTGTINAFLEQWSTWLVALPFKVFCFENWGGKNERNLFTGAHNYKMAQFDKFIKMVAAKAKAAGKAVLQIPKYTRSTCVCSNCGWEYASIKPSIHEWTCPICQTHHDRDLNAAYNIRNYVLKEFLEIDSSEASNTGLDD